MRRGWGSASMSRDPSCVQTQTGTDFSRTASPPDTSSERRGRAAWPQAHAPAQVCVTGFSVLETPACGLVRPRRHSQGPSRARKLLGLPFPPCGFTGLLPSQGPRALPQAQPPRASPEG